MSALKKKLNNYRLFKILQDTRDADGYVDSLKSIEKGRKVLAAIKDRANKADMDINDYLMFMFGVRLSKTYVSVDYVALVEKELLEYEHKYGYENINLSHIEKYDSKLLNRLAYLAKYFPCGSVTSSAVLDFFGYNVQVNEKKKFNEEDVVKKLNMLYPNREVSGLTKYVNLYSSVSRLSAFYDKTIEQYLNSKGFKVLKRQEADRLSRAMVKVNDEMYLKICSIREKLINDSEVLNNSGSTQTEISNELNKIAKCAYLLYSDKEKNVKKSVR